MVSGLGIYVIIIVGAIILLWILLYFIPIGLWFQALVSGVQDQSAAAYLHALEKGAAVNHCERHDRGRQSRDQA